MRMWPQTEAKPVRSAWILLFAHGFPGLSHRHMDKGKSVNGGPQLTSKCSCVINKASTLSKHRRCSPWSWQINIGQTKCIDLAAEKAPHSSTIAWKIPWMEEPGRLQSVGSLRVGHDWATSLSLFTFMHWRRKWQPTPVFLSRESQGWGSLVGCCLWGCTESDTTEVT